MVDKKEQRRIYYDRDSGVEVYSSSGVVQKFLNHLYEYYVIELAEGERCHLCHKGQEYDVETRGLPLLNSRDNHFRGSINGEILDYWAVNVPVDVMNRAVLGVMGEEFTLRLV